MLRRFKSSVTFLMKLLAFLLCAACFFGLFGRGEEYYIPWDCIRQVGDDIILVDKPFPQREPPRRERRARRRRL